MKTYIAHYSPLTERRLHVQKTLDDAGISNVEWVTEEPTEYFLSFYANSANVWDYRNNLVGYPERIPFRQLSKAEISLLFKHYLIFKKIAASEDQYGLVLEDDAILDESFLQKLNNSIEELCGVSKTPSGAWDFIYIGSGCNLRINPERVTSDKTAYCKSHPASKCTDSFLVTKKAARQILKTIFPYCFPADFELNYQMFVHSMLVYWLEPPLVMQGSQTGLYRSRIQI